MKKLGILILLGVLMIGAILIIKYINISGQNEHHNNTTPETETTAISIQTQSQTLTPTDNWKLKWDASKPITINEKKYIVKGIAFDVSYRFSGKPEHKMIIEKGYSKTTLDGKDVYRLYADLAVDGEKYHYIVYTDPEYLEEYTGGILWVPSVDDMINNEGIVKLEIAGPFCTYSMDEEGNIEGDTTCGTTNMDKAFQEYNTILSFPTGFYGGIYMDVLTWVTLTQNGEGYTVKPDNPVTIAGMNFETYKVTWEGKVQGNIAPAKGETTVAPKLPFPVEITASIKMSQEKEAIFYVKLTDLKLEPVD